MASTPDRLSGLSGGKTGYEMSIAVNQSGVVGRVPKYKNMGSGMKQSYEFEIPQNKANWSRSMSSKIQTVLSRPMFDVEPGTVVDVYVDYEVKMTRVADGSTVFVEPLRVEQAVTVLARDTPIVQTINPSDDQINACGHSLSPINLVTPIPDPIPSYGMTALAVHLSLNQMTEPFAFQAYFVMDDEEIEFGTISGIGNPAVVSIQVLQWYINQSDRVVAQSTIDRIQELGQVDIVLRSDAAIANDNPDIQQVLGLTLRFDDVPIEFLDDGSSIWDVRRDTKVNASCQSE